MLNVKLRMALSGTKWHDLIDAEKKMTACNKLLDVTHDTWQKVSNVRWTSWAGTAPRPRSILALTL